MNIPYQSLVLCLVLTYTSFDKVEKDKKLELLRLTLYRNAISETMDMVDLSQETKIKRSQYVASPQKCKTIKNDIPIDVVKIKHNVKNKRKKMINFISISN